MYGKIGEVLRRELDAAAEDLLHRAFALVDNPALANLIGETAIDAIISPRLLAIGLMLTLIHLISIPVTNTSVNPARSTGVAVFVGDWATAQLWLFWVAPSISW